MSYSEKDNLVILTMSREDYDLLLRLLGLGTGVARRNSGDSLAASKRLDDCIELMDRLNSGNSNYRPYQVEAEKK